jgi:hypothetical protein
MQSSLINRILYFFLGLAVAITFSQCKKDQIISDSSANIELSNDSVLFDTVFTSIGSTTRYFKIYNRNSQAISISSIELLGGSNSAYRINVDGDDGTAHFNKELAAGDSIFVFVEVTIDPSSGNLPFVVEDKVRIKTNGNESLVQLSAWGQDAYFHGGLGELFILDCNETWNNDKPHVIYGIVALDEGCTLTINEGTQVYCHAKSGLYIYRSTLNIRGTKNNEVVFQGDRLDLDYRDLPGQWGTQLSFQVEGSGGPEIGTVSRGGIWLYQSPGSSIDYAIIKNGGMGIQVDTTGVDYSGSTPSLLLTNTKILNMSGIGLWAQGGYIKGYNVLVGNCGEACAFLSIGGRYEMDNSTFANYWSNGNRTAATFVLNNYYEDINQVIQVRPLIGSVFRNCIMYGSNASLTDYNEFIVDMVEAGNPEYQFKYCLVDTDINVSDDGNHWESMRNGQAPYLCNPSEGNFKISVDDSRMQGFPFTFDADINQISNGDWKGCYDFDNVSTSPCTDN